MKIVFWAITGIVSAIGGLLIAQFKKYRVLVKKEEDATIKATIINTLDNNLSPIREDIGNMKNDIGKMKTDIKNLQGSEINFSTRLNPIQDEIEHLKDDIQEILNNIKQQGIDLNNIHEKEKHLEHETRCAWRYRIRTLCHAYIRRGRMTHDEFEQLQEMFNLYTAIGGNGQTKELYERTMKLDVLTDAEVAALSIED